MLKDRVKNLESALHSTQESLMYANKAIKNILEWAKLVSNQPTGPKTKSGKPILVSYETPGQA